MLVEHDTEQIGAATPLESEITETTFRYGPGDCYFAHTAHWWADEQKDFMLIVGSFPVRGGDPFTADDIVAAKRAGCGGVIKVNAMDYEAADYDELAQRGVNPCGTFNREHIAALAAEAKAVVTRFGIVPPAFQGYVDRVLAEIQAVCGNLIVVSH